MATIAIVTNATVLPGDALCERLALQGNLLILISDYGDYSKGKSELLERLERHGIPYVFMSGMVWYEHALLLDAYSRSPEEVQESYRMCARNCTSVAERRFSKCQVALSLELLNAIPPEFEALEKSTVDLSACNGPDGAGGKEEIAAHMRSDRAMGACYVCSGMSRDGAVRIPPAVQATGALAYRRF